MPLHSPLGGVLSILYQVSLGGALSLGFCSDVRSVRSRSEFSIRIPFEFLYRCSPGGPQSPSSRFRWSVRSLGGVLSRTCAQCSSSGALGKLCFVRWSLRFIGGAFFGFSPSAFSLDAPPALVPLGILSQHCFSALSGRSLRGTLLVFEWNGRVRSQQDSWLAR